MNSYYYLHKNGDLIHKYGEPGDEVYDSDFVKYVWCFVGEDRDTNRTVAWRMIIESLAMGAITERVLELATKWNCDMKDLPQFMIRNFDSVTDVQRAGLSLFITLLGYDPEKTITHICNTPPGKIPDMTKLVKVVH